MEVDMPYRVIDQNSVKGGFQPERLARGLEVGWIRHIQGIGYGVLEFLEAWIRHIFLDGYNVLVFRIVIFKISSFKLQNVRLLLIFTKYSKHYRGTFELVKDDKEEEDDDEEGDDEEEDEEMEERSGSRFDRVYPRNWIRRIGVFLEYGQRLISSRIFTYYIFNTAYWSSGYGILIFFPLWSLMSAGTDTPYLP
ncbi:hypothetical protein Tco_0802601 [Tanacetum coccineum]|uniref:Uncharacterized protein n=1 Tax=Tanacetum coccineum TaxID=301880 RepID=A0ABQ5A3I2_9ASTR